MSLALQMRDYRLTTAEILYHMPDHPAVLQSYIWQDLDLAPLGDGLRDNRRLGGGDRLGLGHCRGGRRGCLDRGRLCSRRVLGIWARERVLVFTRGRYDLEGDGLVVALRRVCCRGRSARLALAAG